MCEFCENLKSQIQINEYLNQKETEKEYRQMHEYTVAIVDRSWTKSKGKRNAGRTTDYRNQGIGYKLNFCPECCRPIKDLMIEIKRGWKENDNARNDS